MLQISFAFVFVLLSEYTVSGAAEADYASDLPSWISGNPGFQHPTEVDAIKLGSGSISAKGTGSKGWLVFVNEKLGHGIEVEVSKLSLNPNAGEFLLISTWPMLGDFKQIKLFTGAFNNPLKKLRIPNAKIFHILYNPLQTTAEMEINFRRYGLSLELDPTENPAKKQEIVYEVQLKGKAPEEYTSGDFLHKMKEAMRAAARRYSAANNISFNEAIPTEEMVLIYKITSCPFEWPDRDICASLKHSIFVSGLRIPDEKIILDYQLTADHLRLMWATDAFPEVQELGVTVFQLPSTSSTIGYWILIIILAATSSLILGCIFWKANKNEDFSLDADGSRTFEEVKKVKRSLLLLGKHQQVPSFIFADPNDIQLEKFREPKFRAKDEDSCDDVLKPGLPFKNYFGSLLFGVNEDNEDKAQELPSKSQIVQ